MNEQAGLSIDEPVPPFPEPSIGAQPFILSASPPRQVGIDAAEEQVQLFPAVNAEVADPARHDRVYRRGEFVQVWVPKMRSHALSWDFADRAVKFWRYF